MPVLQKKWIQNGYQIVRRATINTIALNSFLNLALGV